MKTGHSWQEVKGEMVVGITSYQSFGLLLGMHSKYKLNAKSEPILRIDSKIQSTLNWR